MANTIVTPTAVATVALEVLENELVFAKLVSRDYDDLFSYKGDTVYIRKPVRPTIRTSATIGSIPDVEEGKVAVAMDKVAGADFNFTSKELTLSMDRIERDVIRPYMIGIANQIDGDLAALSANVWNWVGSPGTNVNSWAGFARGPQRLMEMGVPGGDWRATLSPQDAYALAGSFIQNTYDEKRVRSSIEEARIGTVAKTNVYGTQNVRALTTGARGGTPLVNGASQVSTWTNVKDTNTQTLNFDGCTASITGWGKAGDVFTINNVYAVNPQTKQVLTFLQQFVLTADVNSNGSGQVAATISPAIIATGPYQNVSAAPADNAPMTFVGTAATPYYSNMVFAPQAFTLVTRPLDVPAERPMAVSKSYKGLSVRVIPDYDFTNDVSRWRLDVLYGVKAIYPDLATRLAG